MREDGNPGGRNQELQQFLAFRQSSEHVGKPERTATEAYEIVALGRGRGPRGTALQLTSTTVPAT
jgi:hypothetical protein